MHRIWKVPVAALLSALLFSLTAWAAEVSHGQIYELLVTNQCLKAATTVEAADNRADFLATPYGRMLYGGSTCCAPADTLDSARIDGAVTDLESARGQLGVDSDAWIDSLKATCARARQSVTDQAASDSELLERRGDLFFIASTIIGKVLERCEEPNVTPLATTDRGQELRLSWIVPNPGGASEPPAGYLETLRAAHVAPNPKTAICPPFVAVSANQDPQKVCTAAHRFLDFFAARYGARRPPVWIGLHHYAPTGDLLYDHARKAGEPLRCRGVLGYFDWQRQAIIWRAPAGFFGTFNHELAHAFMFWDAPLLPRWFDEGMAALYENSRRGADGGFQGIENPWRQERLARHGDQSVTPDMLAGVMAMTPLDFESDSLHATIAREASRRLQDCGKLAAIYRAMRAEARSGEAVATAVRELYKPYPDTRIEEWREIIGRDAANDCW